MSRKQFRVSVVGCGTISSMHGTVISQCENVTLVACADILADRANDFAEKYNCTAYNDYITMLETEKPDAVHICTPHYLHFEMTKQACERGVAVFTEKPPIVTTAELDEFIELSKTNDIGICFQNRYNPPTAWMDKELGSGKYGQVLCGRGNVTWRRDESYYEEEKWRGRRDKSYGACLMNQSIHTLDLLLRYLGKPQMVSAQLANHHLNGDYDIEDTFNAYFGYEDDKRGLIYGSTAYGINDTVYVEICTENAIIKLEPSAVEIRENGKEVVRKSFVDETTQGKDYWGTGHKMCINHFYSELASGGKNYIKPIDIKDTMQVVLAIYESGLEEKKVHL